MKRTYTMVVFGILGCGYFVVRSGMQLWSTLSTWWAGSTPWLALLLPAFDLMLSLVFLVEAVRQARKIENGPMPPTAGPFSK